MSLATWRRASVDRLPVSEVRIDRRIRGTALISRVRDFQALVVPFSIRGFVAVSTTLEQISIHKSWKPPVREFAPKEPQVDLQFHRERDRRRKWVVGQEPRVLARRSPLAPGIS
jgi:hypothetical protein